MTEPLQHIINRLKSEGQDYTDFKILLAGISNSSDDISKDDILKFVASDFRIQLHTTPNSIAKVIAHLSKSNNPQNAIDICCGTGNILYYLQNEIDDLTGVEIVENVAELTKFFIPGVHIITADSFKYPFIRKYDLVVGNIPFGMRVEIDGKRLPGEEAFLRRAHELLSDNGRVVMLIPYSVLQSDQFQNFRTCFINYLQEVIVLPAGSIRTVKVKSTLIILSKKTTEEVKLSQLKNFENLTRDYETVDKTTLSKKQIIERWDPGYYLSRKNSFYREMDSFKTSELQELAEIIKGKVIPVDSHVTDGDFLYLRPIHIQKGILKTSNSLNYINKKALSEQDFKYILQPGDIVISTIFNDLKMYVYQSSDVPAIASNNIAIIRSSKQDYIHSYLQTDEGKRIFKTQAEDLRKGVSIPHLSMKDIASIKIPILPVSDLNSFGDAGIKRSTEAQLQDALDQLDQYKTLIQSLEKDNFTEFKRFIENRFNRVESQLEVVNKKLDKLLSILIELKTDFEEIQRLPREGEEKLFKLCQKIDAKLNSIFEREKQTIERYIEQIKRWLNLWELLDLQSKRFLPIAELIFDKLSKIEDADYSPFVVQYCRTLENEILKKLFESYHDNGLKEIDRYILTQADLGNPKTGKFAQMVHLNKITYTLGDMNFIMALLKQGGDNLAESPLLKHFRAFVISYFDKKIVEAEFLNDMNKLTTEFRNKAAHPYTINIDLATECKNLLRKNLNVFMESIKK